MVKISELCAHGPSKWCYVGQCSDLVVSLFVMSYINPWVHFCLLVQVHVIAHQNWGCTFLTCPFTVTSWIILHLTAMVTFLKQDVVTQLFSVKLPVTSSTLLLLKWSFPYPILCSPFQPHLSSCIPPRLGCSCIHLCDIKTAKPSPPSPWLWLMLHCLVKSVLSI